MKNSNFICFATYHGGADICDDAGIDSISHFVMLKNRKSLKKFLLYNLPPKLVVHRHLDVEQAENRIEHAMNYLKKPKDILSALTQPSSIHETFDQSILADTLIGLMNRQMGELKHSLGQTTNIVLVVKFVFYQLIFYFFEAFF